MRFTTHLSYITHIPWDRPRPEAFSITTARHGPHAVVALHGEFDIAAEDEVSAELARVLDARPDSLAVDLRNLTFLDSTGLRALLGLRTACDELGCRLLLIRGAPAVQRAFEVSGLAEHFEFADSE